MITVGVLILIATVIITAIAISVRDSNTKPSRDEVRRLEKYHQAHPIQPVVVTKESDDHAIRDHQRLVEQYRYMVDELYNYGEDVVRRSRHES